MSCEANREMESYILSDGWQMVGDARNYAFIHLCSMGAGDVAGCIMFNIPVVTRSRDIV